MTPKRLDMMRAASSDVVGRRRRCDGGSSGSDVAAGRERQALSRIVGETRGAEGGVERGGGVEG